MRLVEKEHQLGFVGIADLGQGFEQLGQQPQQEGRIETRRGHQLIRRQNIDPPAPVRVALHDVPQAERGFAEQPRAALIFKDQQPALDRPDRGRGDIAIAQGQVDAVFPHPDQQRLQILQIQQRHPLFIRDAKGDVQNALLRLAELHQTGQQQRTHLGHGGADRVALIAKQVPEGHGKGSVLQVQPDGACAFGKRAVQFRLGRSRGRQT